MLVDFETSVEQRESDGIRCVLQRFAPLFKFLFDRYTVFRALPADHESLKDRHRRVGAAAAVAKRWRDVNDCFGGDAVQ